MDKMYFNYDEKCEQEKTIQKIAFDYWNHDIFPPIDYTQAM